MKTPGERDTYSINAEFWVKIIREKLDRYRTELTDQAVFNAVGSCEGARVLDVGCGEGYMSRKLAKAGANVTGFDASPALVQKAVEESKLLDLNIHHYVALAESIPEPDGSFDIAVCNHVMTDIADPVPVMKELGRVVKSGGRVIILMLHPCFYAARSERNQSGQLPATQYFTTRTLMQTFEVAGITSPGQVVNTFRPLEQYMAAIFDGGFVVTGLSEPHPTQEQVRDPWWREAFKQPLFLLLEGTRR